MNISFSKRFTNGTGNRLPVRLGKLLHAMGDEQLMGIEVGEARIVTGILLFDVYRAALTHFSIDFVSIFY